MANSLVVTEEVLFGSDGNATIVIGPRIRGEVWNVAYLSVSTNNESPFITQAYVYRDSISENNLLEASADGNGDNTNANIRLTAPELLWVQWRNGSPGTRAMLRLEGEREF